MFTLVDFHTSFFSSNMMKIRHEENKINSWLIDCLIVGLAANIIKYKVYIHLSSSFICLCRIISLIIKIEKHFTAKYELIFHGM
jgi:hypothetical protein